MIGGFVERLVVGVGYKTDTGSIRTVMGEFKGAFNALTGFSTMLVSAAAASGIFALAQAANVDQTAKLARQLRTNTEELTAHQFAAARSGIEHTRFRETMIRLDTAMAQAASGEGNAAEALRHLGISAHNADGSLRGPIDSLADIADGLERLEEGQRGRVMQALFGEQGAYLRPLLEGGGEGVRALTDEAERLGLVLSSKTAQSAEDLMDSVEGLKGAVRGLSFQVGDVLFPPLTRTVEGLTGWVTQSDGIVRSGLDRFVRGLSWTLTQLETPLGRGVAGVFALAGVIGARQGLSLLTSTLHAAPGLGRLAGGLGAAGGKGLVAAAALALAALAIDDIVVTAQGGDSVLRRFTNQLGIGEETSQAFADAGSILKDSLSGLTVVAGQLGTEIRRSVHQQFQQAEEDARNLAIALGLPEEALNRIFNSLRENLTLVNLLAGLTTAPRGWAGFLSQGAIGWSEFARFAAGDTGVERVGGGQFDTLDEVLLAPAARAQRGGREDNARAGGLSIYAQVGVTAGPSKTEIADAAADEVRRQVYRELDAVGILE